METQGIIIWARPGTGALIVWCSDSSALAYVADRRREGDAEKALAIGDFVDLTVECRGALRVGRRLRFRATGPRRVADDLRTAAAPHRGPVMSPQAWAEGLMFWPDTGELAPVVPAPAVS